MLTSGKNKKPLQNLLGIVSTALITLAFSTSSIALAQSNTSTPTTINISDTPKLTNAQRLGVNLGTQNFWDSGIIMRNLSFRNPGFEAETWQSTLHCKVVTSTSCTDDNAYNYWPANFLKGATASFIVGPAAGTSATVTSNTAAKIGAVGLTMQFSGLSVAPSAGDFLVVRMNVPGNPLAGWWTQSGGGATFAVDTTDLSPNTPGKQAVAVNASGSGQSASIFNFDDGSAGKQFLHLSGTYTVSFRAKGTGGSNQVKILLSRSVTGATENFWSTTVNLTNGWKDYSYSFQITNDTTKSGSIGLSFGVAGSSMLIDDVAFTEAASDDNPTAYRNAVVEALRDLHPGSLRYMDTGLNWGSSIDNLLAPDFARTRSGYNTGSSEIDDIAMGLHDFLVLCKAVGADPWFTMPTGMTTQEMSNLMDYFGGSTSTAYGARRAALGQATPWTSVFGQIHLEFGNEVWNTGNGGANIADPVSYGKRANVIFGVARASSSYNARSFDLVVDGFEAVPYWTQQVLQNCSTYDTVSTASYNFDIFDDTSSTEAIFGPMLAEPEFTNSTAAGLTNEQAVAAATAGPKPAKLAVYETNVGTITGSATQAQVQSTVPSVAAGISVAANMLLAQRDLGVTVQHMFALEGYSAPFYPKTPGSAGAATSSPIWGTVIDMGGATNLRRPMFLSEQLANTAILPTLLSSSQTGLNPTWNQPFSTNDNFALPAAHYIQNITYTDGTTLNIVLFNMSRTSALPVNFAGLNAPMGTATKTVLTAPTLTATNENAENVKIVSSSQSLTANTVLSLPPFSMTVLSLPKPIVPIQVYAVTSSCTSKSLSSNGTAACTATVTGQGKYSTDVTWSAVYGSVSSNGNYTAPGSYPASGKDVVTATAVGDHTKTASFTIAIQPDAVTGIAATCPASTLGQGKSVSCAAVVTGTGGFSSNYTWSASVGTITPAGAFTAPITGTSATLIATSKQDPSKSSKVTLALTPVLNLGPITSTVTGTTATLNWTVNMPANSAIAYGPTAAMLLSTNYNPSTNQNVSITLTGLKPSTTYYMHPYSFNATQVANGATVVTTASSSSTVTGVTVSCPATSLLLGASAGCAAKVTGTGSYSSGVTWSTSLGSISVTGVLTAPLSVLGTSITVKATSVQDPTRSGTAVISLSQSSSITAVSLACQATSLAGGGTTTCTPTVTGSGSFSKSVTFSTSAGTITSGGVLTAPTTGTSVTVKATSVQDPTKSATAVIALSSKLSMSSVTSVVTDTTAVLSWTVDMPANNGVSYRAASGASGITPYVQAQTANPRITLTGLQPSTTYTASAFSFNGSQTVATPVTFTTKSASTTVTIVAVSCASTTLAAGKSTACTSAVTGTGNFSAAVTWSTSAGTITSAGVLTAPTTGTSVVVKATSVQDPTRYATRTVTVTPLASISGVTVSCSASKLSAGSSTPCVAIVAGTGSYSSAVTWSTSAGSISTTGLLKSPTSGNSLTVKATSVQDPTKSASETIALTAQSSISSVTIECPKKEMSYSASMSCGAYIQGTGTMNTAVSWTASAGSVNFAGVVTAPATGSSLTLTATSKQDPTKFATSTIALSSPQNLKILNPTFFATPTTIVVSWTVTEPAHNGVDYDKGPGTPWATTPYLLKTTTTPSFTFTDLKPGTTYQGIIFSFTDAGETVTQNVTVSTPLK